MQEVRGQGTKPLPLLVDTRFQVLFHSPNRGAFHLSITVLVHYRSQRSISPWIMVDPVSHGVPRAPWYSGTLSGSHQSFAYGAFTLYSGSFQRPSAKLVIYNFPARP